MPYMYILECNDGTFYTGSTWNLEKRVFEHNNGIGANYTSSRLPAKLVYCEEYDRIDEAFYREKQVQGWSRAKKKALISGKYDVLQFSAKKAFSKRKSADVPFDTPLRGTQGTDPAPIRSSSSEAPIRSSSSEAPIRSSSSEAPIRSSSSEASIRSSSSEAYRDEGCK